MSTIQYNTYGPSKLRKKIKCSSEDVPLGTVCCGSNHSSSQQVRSSQSQVFKWTLVNVGQWTDTILPQNPLNDVVEAQSSTGRLAINWIAGQPRWTQGLEHHFSINWITGRPRWTQGWSFTFFFTSHKKT